MSLIETLIEIQERDRNKSSVTSIKYCHKFQLDLGKDVKRCGQGESLHGEKFSPISGTVLQLKFLKLDNTRFIIFLKNCGNESVDILQFKVKSERAGKEVEKNNCFLSPGGVEALPDLVFRDFSRNKEHYDFGIEEEFYKEFQCLLDIHTRGKHFLCLTAILS